MVQDVIVGLIVLAAALYSVWLLMPAGTRHAAAGRLASLAHGCGLGEQQSQRLQATLATHSSCSECASCKGCVKPATEAASIAAQQPGVSGDTEQPRSL
ncbi:MAG TPA: hypothetical protein VN663_05450 [Ramlibacter sp.]|nr:hypothetical protein [Ramlibacter sp.]